MRIQLMGHMRCMRFPGRFPRSKVLDGYADLMIATMTILSLISTSLPDW